MLILFLSSLGSASLHHLPNAAALLALIEGKDVDIMYQIQNGWETFIKTGQVWALIIGFVLGYMFRGMTSY
jgi:hypothetical protein